MNRPIRTQAAVSSQVRNTAGRALANLRRGGTVFVEDEQGRISLPAPVARQVEALLAAYAAGQSPAVFAPEDELSTQEAADILGLSRPTVVKMMDDGRLPFRKPGAHRKVLRTDLMAFKEALDKDRRATLAELSALGQEMERLDREAGTLDDDML